MVSLMFRICSVQLAENLRHEASGVKTPEELQRLTAGLKPRPSTIQPTAEIIARAAVEATNCLLALGACGLQTAAEVAGTGASGGASGVAERALVGLEA